MTGPGDTPRSTKISLSDQRAIDALRNESERVVRGIIQYLDSMEVVEIEAITALVIMLGRYIGAIEITGGKPYPKHSLFALIEHERKSIGSPF